MNRSISPILHAHSWLSIEFMHNMGMYLISTSANGSVMGAMVT
jgi:hypothetical protein